MPQVRYETKKARCNNFLGGLVILNYFKQNTSFDKKLTKSKNGIS